MEPVDNWAGLIVDTQALCYHLHPAIHPSCNGHITKKRPAYRLVEVELLGLGVVIQAWRELEYSRLRCRGCEPVRSIHTPNAATGTFPQRDECISQQTPRIAGQSLQMLHLVTATFHRCGKCCGKNRKAHVRPVLSFRGRWKEAMDTPFSSRFSELYRVTGVWKACGRAVRNTESAGGNEIVLLRVSRVAV